jgi:phosphate transporter
MKFSKQIRFVAVKAWYDHYINFKAFKKMIIQGAARLTEAHDNGATEEEINELRANFVEEFSHKLYKALNGVTSFYASNYVDMQKEIDDISIDINEHAEYSARNTDAERSFTKRVFGATLTAYELRTFLEINKTAGRKIVKKLSRIIGCDDFREEYQAMQTELFRNLPEIENLLNILEDQYVTIHRDIGEVEDTRSRPEIVMELHNKVDSALAWKQSTVLTNFNAIDFRRSEISPVAPHQIKPIPVVIAFIFIIAFSVTQFTQKLDYKAQKCIGIVGFCSILWATGAVPLWLSSLCVPMWAVVLDVIPGFSYKDIGKFIEQSTMNSTVFLTMGGFTIAAALKATEMDKRLATMILKKATSHKAIFLLVCSFLNAFIAMWISNITSTMIVVTLVGPTLRSLPTESNYAKAVVLSIAVGGNLGGMLTPLASPQNAVTCDAVADAAKGYIDASVSFAEFFETALPLGIICALAAWGIILLKYPIDIQEVPPIPDVKTDFGWRQIFVSIVSIAIIVIWITLPFGAEKVFSDNGIVGFLPMIIFYGAGIIQPSQITELPWHIIFLLMGGNALSTTVRKSGLNDVVSDLMQDMLGDQSLWVSMLIINLIVIIIDFFLTHTVSSMITEPIVATFARTTGHLELYCMSACMTTTASQILPVSSFPNMCCVSLQDDNKKEYVSSSEMIKWGITITVVCFTLVMTAHYGIGLAALD